LLKNGTDSFFAAVSLAFLRVIFGEKGCLSPFFSTLLATASLLCAQNVATIQGRVTNSVTGEPVGGVKVAILDRQSHVLYTMTDPTGSYRFTGLSDGDYRGEFSKDGFTYSPASPIFGGNLWARVAGDIPVQINVQMHPLGTMRGRVADEDGNPVAGVRVELGPMPIRQFDDSGKVTDQNGEFLFQDLAAGSYTLAAKPQAKIKMQDGVRVGPVTLFYLSVTELAQAVPIHVHTGENVSGIEIRLKNMPVYRVAGVVLNEEGKPAAHATVKLMGRASALRQQLSTGIVMPIPDAQGRVFMRGLPTAFNIVGPGPEPEVARIESRADGAFEFAAVARGEWRLTAEIGVEDEMPRSGMADAIVSEKDVDEVQIRLSAPFAVEVTADWGSAQDNAARGRGMLLGLAPVEGQPRVSNPRLPNGSFPGRYRVTPAFALGSFYVASVLWGGRDVNGQIVELSPGSPPFQVVLKKGLGTVTGRVDKGEGVNVFLVSHDSGEILTYRQTTCGAGGTFEIRDVQPGDYYVVAFNRTERDVLPAADLPFAIMPLASSVRVESGSTAQVDLSVSKWPW
jgi:hypothetical protein